MHPPTGVQVVAGRLPPGLPGGGGGEYEEGSRRMGGGEERGRRGGGEEEKRGTITLESGWIGATSMALYVLSSWRILAKAIT